VAGRVNLANGHAFAPTFRPGPPPPTQSIDGRILARLAVAPGSPRVLASILDIKESFVALHLRNRAVVLFFPLIAIFMILLRV
jgi:hypothetical protein